MNRVDRLLALILLLQSKRVITADEMARHFELSVRTIYRDLDALGEAGVPIAAEAGVGYSLVKGYHLPPVMFTAEEASALSTGGQLVAHLTDSSLSKHMDSALLKIRSVLPANHRDYLDRLERSTAVVARSTNGVPNLAGDTLIPIQRAIAERRVLAMEYEGGQRREITRREAEPLGLLYYADRWHVIAYCRLRRDFRDFRTDRIRKLQLLGEQFVGHADFSLKRYLESTVKDAERQTARVRFAAGVMDRVRREWYCGLVEEQAERDAVIVTLLVYSLEWLTGWLLSFGASAMVIAPDRLKHLVTAEARKVMTQYTPSPQVKLPAHASTRRHMGFSHRH
jgi:predicted DNA-binding transcriptional regulator YafY